MNDIELDVKIIKKGGSIRVDIGDKWRQADGYRDPAKTAAFLVQNMLRSFDEYKSDII